MSDPLGETSLRRVVLLRHGRTAWNLAGRAQGQTDVPLDEVGHAQAAAAAVAVAALEPDVLVTSDLVRAAGTAAYLEKATGLTARHDPRLREIHWGVREGSTLEEFRAAAPEAYAAWEGSGRLARIPGGESEDEVAARVRAAVRESVDALGAGETLVLVSHGAALKAAVATLLGWDDAGPLRLRATGNCTWSQVDVRPDGSGVLAAYNVPT
ncbi:MAG: histidine phosphatase family protein [Nocardioides sp.]|nr:histidine phosphatase family protein [Nocardioides sp.]